MHESTFFAYERDPDKFSTGPRTLVGVSHDIAREVDERNGWLEPADPVDSFHDELVKISARGLMELLMYCFHDVTLSQRSRGVNEAFGKFCAVALMINSEELLMPAPGATTAKDTQPLTKRDLAALLNVPMRTLTTYQRQFKQRWGFRLHVSKRVERQP
jgi:hypothetical protein